MQAIIEDMDIENDTEVLAYIKYLPTVFNEGFIDNQTKIIVVPEHQLFKNI